MFRIYWDQKYLSVGIKNTQRERGYLFTRTEKGKDLEHAAIGSEKGITLLLNANLLPPQTEIIYWFPKARILTCLMLNIRQ